MPRLVLDASTALSWIMPDETAAKLDAVQQAVADQGALVPSLWPLEIANALLAANRRGRIDAAFRVAALADLAALPIEIDAETHLRASSDTLALADTHGLSVYDAAYLELSLRKGLALATLDGQLGAAATRLGLLFPIR